MKQVSTIMGLISSFSQGMTKPTYENPGVLTRGAILASGARTVTACIRAASPWATRHFTAYENVMRRAKLNGRQLGRILFSMIEEMIPAGDTIALIVDDSLVRRFGPHVAYLGIHRDALRNRSGGARVLSLGHKWVILSVGVKLPFKAGWLALPILSELYTTVNAPNRSKVRAEKKHRTPARIAKLLVAIVAGWAPERRFRLVCDKAYATHDMADSMNEKGKHPRLRRVTMVSRMQMDAGLYAPPKNNNRKGRRRVKGDRLPSPAEAAGSPNTQWARVEVAWYGGERKLIDLVSGTGLWYKCGTKATWVMWVMMRDPDGKREDQVIFTTEKGLSPAEVAESFVGRWSLEATFEETRRHLGLETLRNRSTLAVSRSVPLLLALFSFIVVWFATTNQEDKMRIASAPWYDKKSFTFSDMLDSARFDILNDLFSIRGRLKPCVFFLAPFPLNLYYAGFLQKSRSA